MSNFMDWCKSIGVGILRVLLCTATATLYGVSVWGFIKTAGFSGYHAVAYFAVGTLSLEASLFLTAIIGNFGNNA